LGNSGGEDQKGGPAGLCAESILKTESIAFIDSIPYHERPGSWDGDDFEVYLRYMTAILTWAKMKGWTTSEVERTVSLEFQPDWNKFRV
jgi:hypothetical protein